MARLALFSTLLSIGLFLYYGIACLFFDGMVEEFERYGLSRYRRLTGTLELLGAVGLAVGWVLPWATVMSAAGLALLMLLGVITRLRVGDPLPQAMPALVLLIGNGFIFLHALGALGAAPGG